MKKIIPFLFSAIVLLAGCGAPNRLNVEPLDGQGPYTSAPNCVMVSSEGSANTEYWRQAYYKKDQ